MFAFFNDFFCLLYRRWCGVVTLTRVTDRAARSCRVYYARLCQRTDILTVQQPSGQHKNCLRFCPVTLCSTDGHVHREFILFVFVHPWPLLLVITISDSANASGRCGTVLCGSLVSIRTGSVCEFIMSLALECDVYGTRFPASVRLLCMQNI